MPCDGTGKKWCGCAHGFADPAEPTRSIEVWTLHSGWIKIIRGVVDKQNKKIAPTKRLVTTIQKAIQAETEAGSTIHVGWKPDGYGFYEITVWIETPRCNEWDDRLHLSWSKGPFGGVSGSLAELQALDHPSWANLEIDLQRNDYADFLERIEQEKTIADTLSRINGEIAQYEAKIEALRGAGDRLIAELPKPKAAVLRSFWSQPTIAARTYYPAIWPSKKD
jgi:hypothetical protein